VLSLKKGYCKYPIEIMAYRQFSIVNGEIVKKLYPITADYDELVAAPRKVYPFHQNKSIRTEFNLHTYKRLANHNLISPIELTVELILEYELREKKQHREAILSQQQPQMGMVTDWQRDIKAHLKIETQGATNHGPEVNNPFPVEFCAGNYAVHLPNGSIIVLHNEKEVCQFINQQRTLGFPLDVNPKWGWELNKKGELFVPDVRFDWKLVHEELAVLQATINSQEDDLEKNLALLGIKDCDANLDALLRYSEDSEDEFPDLEKTDNFEGEISIPQGRALQSIARNIHKLHKMTIRQVDEQELSDLKVKIEKLRLEPNIVYSKFVNNKGQTPHDIGETDGECEFRKIISRKVKLGEEQSREQQIQMLEQNSEKKKEEFYRRHKENSIVEDAEETLQTKRKEKKDVNLSAQKFSFFRDEREVEVEKSSHLLEQKFLYRQTTQH
jgi:hypothetical protein